MARYNYEYVAQWLYMTMAIVRLLIYVSIYAHEGVVSASYLCVFEDIVGHMTAWLSDYFATNFPVSLNCSKLSDSFMYKMFNNIWKGCILGILSVFWEKM